MNKLIQPGRLIFAIGIIALGIICFISKDFIVGRPPAWPDGWAVNPVLAYVSGALLILSSLAIIFNKRGAAAALVIAALILLLSIFRHLPHFMNDWLNTYKAMALFGGSLVIASTFLKEGGGVQSGLMSTENLRRSFVITGSLLLAVFFIAGGYAHFKFADFVKNFIPAYIPFRIFWAYFCGVCLFAGGLGILLPLVRKWAALLSGIMLAGWFLLLHIPRFIANTNDASDRMGLCESFTFAGIFFVLAGVFALSNRHDVHKERLIN